MFSSVFFVSKKVFFSSTGYSKNRFLVKTNSIQLPERGLTKRLSKISNDNNVKAETPNNKRKNDYFTEVNEEIKK